MMNRPIFTPIISAVVLSLSVGPVFVARAQTDSAPPLATSPAPAATPAPATTPAPEDASGAMAERPATYTVVSGDSLWLIAHKFHTSVKKLKKLNSLTTNNLKPGQVLQIPPAPGSTNTPATPAPAQPKSTKHHKAKTIQPSGSEVARALRAQPVQDFDVPASTFASCPVPVPVEPDATDASPIPAANPPTPADSEPVAEEEPPAPRAVPVSSADLAATSAPEEPADTVTPASVPEPAPAPSGLASSQSSKRSGAALVSDSTFGNEQGAPVSPSANDWADRFKIEAENLANLDIDYDEDWRPPGESHAWAMDCSNTSRYLYKVTTGIELPRTASDQYYYLHLQNKAWDVPQGSDGFADTNYLRDNLKPGDLLFWKNTYRPERQPPITHVMIFLGTNEQGRWIMAGSQTSRGGLHNRRHGGPDIYVFDPAKPCGGYSTWLGLVHHQGRFCAFGRPLEADPAKLAVATDK